MELTEQTLLRNQLNSAGKHHEYQLEKNVFHVLREYVSIRQFKKSLKGEFSLKTIKATHSFMLM